MDMNNKLILNLFSRPYRVFMSEKSDKQTSSFQPTEIVNKHRTKLAQ